MKIPANYFFQWNKIRHLQMLFQRHTECYNKSCHEQTIIDVFCFESFSEYYI
jgi:hypothetical protein